jgi:hypothetical protein
MELQLSTRNISQRGKAILCKWDYNMINEILRNEMHVLGKDINHRERMSIEESFSIGFLDSMICLTLSWTSPSNESQGLIEKLLHRIYDSSFVQNPAQFWCIAFRREVGSAFAS